VARKPSEALTDGELRIMRVLWDLGRATVGDVVERLEGGRRPAYNTVLTMLRILERKKYIAHQKSGRAFVFRPLVDRGAVRRSALSQLMARLFENSPELLVLNLLESERCDEAELQRVRQLVKRSARPDRES
jgi:predicted transcriptional regulator